MMSVIDQKISTTQFVLSELSKKGTKVSFIPDAALIDALRVLEEKGIPNNKHEDYKYCNVEGVLKREFKAFTTSFTSITTENTKKYTYLSNTINLFVVNGVFDETLSDITKLPNGLRVTSLEKTDKSILDKHITRYANVNNDALVALNTAFAENGICIHVAANSVIEKPIHIINIISASDAVIINPRHLIILEKSAQATVVESFYSSAKSFNNYVLEVAVGENAQLDNYKIQIEGKAAHQINNTHVTIAKYGKYSGYTYTLDGAMVRNNLDTYIADELAEAHLYGLFVTKGQQLVDNHTLVDHQKPNCESNELYKGIAFDKSTGIFNGKIFVQRDAQKTNAYQSSKNILMSDDATINTKPQLEIYANDVKCSHGTSTGKIDEEALFYLKSRGIGEEIGRKLLLQAFAHEVIDQIKFPELKEKVSELFEQSLH